MKKLGYLTIGILSLCSCEKLILGTDETDAPQNNFEIFWNDFDQHYGLFEARGWNWDSIHAGYSPQVNSQTPDEELWEIFKEMIGYLDDGHTSIYNPATFEGYSSGSEDDVLRLKEFSISLLKEKYLENIGSFAGPFTEDYYFYGKVKDKNIGYLYLNDIELDNPNVIDMALSNIMNHKALIIDIRNNGGGLDKIADALAGRFADGEHFIYTVQERNGPEHSDFSDKVPYFTGRKGKQHFEKPVVLLTDRITASAAEIFTLHMESFHQVTHIGDTTAGDFSDTGMQRFLPNGWLFRYSIMMYLLPDGKSLDGIGCAPDIYVKNTFADIEAREDKVIEMAIQYLFNKYGIE